MKHIDYSDEDIKLAVKLSFSKSQTLIHLGLVPKGGNYKVLDRNIKRLNIDTSHFSGQGWNKGKTLTLKQKNKSIPLVKILMGDHPKYLSHKLKQRLIKVGLKKHQCERCELTTWEDQPIPLELDHIDGNSSNHKFSNIQLLCPNCHALTDNYRGKNILKPINNITAKKIKEEKLGPIHGPKVPKIYYCECGNQKTNRGLDCRSCAAKKTNKPKIIWPSIDELVIRLEKSNYTQLAKELGVSDNAIRKHIERNN